MGRPVCPHCDHAEKIYFLKTRGIFKCSKCRRQFSVTSGTVFAHHKLPLQDYLAAIAIFTNAVKGISMLQLSRDLDVQYKTAFVLAHKIRESIYKSEGRDALDGQVEIDGAYFLKHVRPSNHKDNRVDRRKTENQSPNKCCVISIRKRGEEGEGAKESRAFVVKNENSAMMDHVIRQAIEEHATVHADEGTAYNNLTNYVDAVKRVNHSEMYVDTKTGASVNQAESYFSRLRRSYIGQHHHMSQKYLLEFATEMAFREDTRRWDNGTIYKEITRRCATAPESKFWKGYWQGNHKPEVQLI